MSVTGKVFEEKLKCFAVALTSYQKTKHAELVREAIEEVNRGIACDRRTESRGSEVAKGIAFDRRN